MDGNVATTTVIFIPEVKDQDKILYCKAKNLHVSTKTVEDQWKIKVACKCAIDGLIRRQEREGYVFMISCSRVTTTYNTTTTLFFFV